VSEAAPDPTEAFIARLFAPEDPDLRRIREAMKDEGLPDIALPATTARTVQLLLRLIGARKVLEVGTLAGYSALWIARALPSDGRLTTIDRDPARSALAGRLLSRAGVSERVELKVGNAGELLRRMGPEGGWDAVFLDADKEGLPEYLTEARRLLRPGGLLLVDNALWKGKVVDPGASDEATVAIREALVTAAGDPALDATLLPVGDGLLVARRS
jgi:predicted O-methyltransferase YrrM